MRFQCCDASCAAILASHTRAPSLCRPRSFAPVLLVQTEFRVRHSASRGVVSQRDLTKVVERFTSGAATSTLDLLIPTGLKFREAVGFSVGGGQYQPVVPGDTAIYVANISPDSATGRSGLLQIGDRIDEIN